MSNYIFKKCSLAIAVCSAVTAIDINATQIDQTAETYEKIVVTGSRIPRANLVSASAVTVIDKKTIEASPYRNIGDILQTMVVSQPSANSLTANGSGVTRFDLRGIGTQRTLVLINGRRLPAGGSGADSAVDLSAIPTVIIDQVEILMDGASAIYGSDAIAGVVNIITKKDYEGFEVSASYGDNLNGDGAKTNIEFVAGISGDKGNVTFAGSYTKDEAIYSSQVDFSKSVVRLEDDGSVTPWGSYWLPWTAVTDPETGKRLTQGPEYGEFHEFSNTDRYNYHEQSYLQQPTEKYTMSTIGVYEFGELLGSEDVKLDFEVMYSHRNNNSNSAAQPLIPWIGGYDDIPISKDNYYNQQFGPKDSNGQAFDIFKWSKRMNDFGPRESTFSNNQYRFVLALSGDFNETWSWETAFNFGRFESQEKRGGVFNWARVREAVGPTHTNAEGELRCGSGPDDIKFIQSTCIPLNVFVGPNEQADPRAMAYVSGDWDNLRFGFTSVQTLTFDVTGTLMELPAGDLSIATGLSYMEQKGRMQTDSNAVHAMTTDGNGRPTGGKYHVEEVYVELNIPVLSEHDFAKSLELNVASRYSNYSTGAGNTTNSKASLVWAVNDDLTLRTTASQAFRAANIQELFAGQLPSFASGIDPCKTQGDEPLRALDPVKDSGCIATGAPAAGFRDGLDSIRINAGGNPNLDPETATIQTVGFALTPTAFENFSISADYYDIKLEDTISTFSPVRKIELCNETGAFCDDINRYESGPLQGVLLGVDNYNENLNASHYRGIDTEANYQFEIDNIGSFTTQLSWHHGLKHEVSIFDGGITDYIGTHTSSGGHQPKNKFNFSLNWQKEALSAGWVTYVIGESTTPGRAEDYQYKIDSWSYSNLNVNYRPKDNIAYSVGINNVFDQAPRRTMLTAGNTNSSGAYSPAFLGSSFFLRAKYTF